MLICGRGRGGGGGQVLANLVADSKAKEAFADASHSRVMNGGVHCPASIPSSPPHR